MTKESVKKVILKKFGTMARFCRLSGYDRYELQKVMSLKSASPMELAKISDLAHRTDSEFGSGKITVKIRKSLVDALLKRGGINRFCNDNPKFNKVTVYQILDGTRKTITAKVKELILELGVKV